MTTNDTYVGKYIQPCTPQLALEVGENLRWEDIREVEETTGLTAPAAVLESYYRSAFSVYFKNNYFKLLIRFTKFRWMLDFLLP